MCAPPVLTHTRCAKLTARSRPQITYKQTKDYLVSVGLTRKELTGAISRIRAAGGIYAHSDRAAAQPTLLTAANKFQLKEIAESKGIDLAPLLEKRDEVAAALLLPVGSIPMLTRRRAPR